MNSKILFDTNHSVPCDCSRLYTQQSYSLREYINLNPSISSKDKSPSPGRRQHRGIYEYNTYTLSISVLALYIPLFWHLLEEGNLSLKLSGVFKFMHNSKFCCALMLCINDSKIVCPATLHSSVKNIYGIVLNAEYFYISCVMSPYEFQKCCVFAWWTYEPKQLSSQCF